MAKEKKKKKFCCINLAQDLNMFHKSGLTEELEEEIQMFSTVHVKDTLVLNMWHIRQKCTYLACIQKSSWGRNSFSQL